MSILLEGLRRLGTSAKRPHDVKHFTRRLARRLLVALLALAAVTVSLEVMLQGTFADQEREMEALQRSGDSRVVSQRLARSAALAQSASSPLALSRELEWMQSHLADFTRLNGEIERARNEIPRSHTPAQREAERQELQAAAGELVAAATALQAHGASAVTAADRLVLVALARRLSEADRSYRQILERQVTGMVASATARLRFLRTAERGQVAVGLLLLVLIGVGIFRPASRRLDEAIERLEWSEGRKRAILESSPDAILTFDASGRALDLNPAAEKLLGKPMEALVGRPLSDLFRFEDASIAAAFLAPLGEGERSSPRPLEFRAVLPDGRARLIEAKITPLFGVTHPLFTAFLEDITDRKSAEVELRRSLEEISRSNEELERFAIVASHDLQEPLRMVSSYVNLLAQRYKGRLDASADEFIRFAADGATRMRRLIQDLLAFSRVSPNTAEWRELDTGVLVGEVLKDFHVTLRETGARIQAVSLPKVKGNPIQLKQMFQNLIGNAIKYRGERAPEIRIGFEERDQEWEFRVKDNGIGFDMKDASRIFEAFQRLHGKGEVPGTGIGLAICSRIARAHGGRIWCESEEHEGSTFYFTLAKEPKVLSSAARAG